MVAYCQSRRCFRGVILDYFGQDHPENCGSCGNCASTFSDQDITVPAQMILSCVLRVREKLGYFVGTALIVQVLRGSRRERVLDLKLDRLSTYGLMRDYSAAQVRACIDELIVQEYLFIRPEHQTLELTAQARDVLFRGKTVSLSRRYQMETRARKRGKRAAAAADAPAALLDALKALRTRIAQEEHLPPYLVFSNAALTDMAARRPHTPEEFLEVNGAGKKKAARYGAVFLEAIRAYEEEKGEETE